MILTSTKLSLRKMHLLMACAQLYLLRTVASYIIDIFSSQVKCSVVITI